MELVSDTYSEGEPAEAATGTSVVCWWGATVVAKAKYAAALAASELSAGVLVVIGVEEVWDDWAEAGAQSKLQARRRAAGARWRMPSGGT